MNSVAYECGVSGRTEKWLCYFPRNDLVVLLDIALHYFISRINWVNETRKQEVITAVCDSVNHTRFPKEHHLPDWARRDNKVTKDGRGGGVPMMYSQISIRGAIFKLITQRYGTLTLLCLGFMSTRIIYTWPSRGEIGRRMVQFQVARAVASYLTLSQNFWKRLLAASRLSVCLSVCLSVRMKESSFQWAD